MHDRFGVDPAEDLAYLILFSDTLLDAGQRMHMSRNTTYQWQDARMAFQIQALSILTPVLLLM
jgi:hypothetical protein